MTRNTSLADLPERVQQQVAPQIIGQEKRKAAPPKYRNQPTMFRSIQGFEIRCASKLEAKLFASLDNQFRAHLLFWWEPYPRFHLPGGIVYEADALALSTEGAPRIIDAKGVETRVFEIKRRLMAERGLSIELYPTRKPSSGEGRR